RAALSAWGIPSRAIRDRLENRPAFQSAVAIASSGNSFPSRGRRAHPRSRGARHRGGGGERRDFRPRRVLRHRGNPGGGARLRSARARPRLAGVVPVTRVRSTVTRVARPDHRYGKVTRDPVHLSELTDRDFFDGKVVVWVRSRWPGSFTPSSFATPDGARDGPGPVGVGGGALQLRHPLAESPPYGRRTGRGGPHPPERPRPPATRPGGTGVRPE